MNPLQSWLSEQFRLITFPVVADYIEQARIAANAEAKLATDKIESLAEEYVTPATQELKDIKAGLDGANTALVDQVAGFKQDLILKVDQVPAELAKLLAQQQAAQLPVTPRTLDGFWPGEAS